MSGARDRRTVFGEVAETYDDVRPGYPSALVDDVLARSGSPGTALEVGAGTGKATAAFAARGVQVVALEPSAPMAAIARRACPRARIVESGFEDWEPSGRFPLLFSAQAWHWVDPAVRYAKARACLHDDGVLALFWNRQSWRDTPLRAALAEAYARHAPELVADGLPGEREHAGDAARPAEIAASGRFSDVVARVYRSSERYPAERYVRLVSTHSDHLLLEPARRAALLAAVGSAIGEHGGAIDLDYRTMLFLARAA